MSEYQESIQQFLDKVVKEIEDYQREPKYILIKSPFQWFWLVRMDVRRARKLMVVIHGKSTPKHKIDKRLKDVGFFRMRHELNKD